MSKVQNDTTDHTESFVTSPTSLKAPPTQESERDQLTKIVYKMPPLGLSSKKLDFTNGVCCILHGTTAALKDDAGKNVFECSDMAMMHVNFNYDKNDEVISRFVHLRYTGEEDIFGEADITLIMPHCLSRSSALYREAVVKAKINNTWVYLGTEETNVDEYKDARFVQAKLTGGTPTHVCVVSRFKRDTIKFSKHASRNTSSVDQRLTIKSETGCFTSKQSFIMQLQPVDGNTISRIQSTVANGRALMCSSNIVSIVWGEHKFAKSCTVNLPIPANPVKIKKLARAEALKAEAAEGKKRRQETRREEKLNKWYMGMYGEDENDKLFLFHFDIMSESWTHLPDVQLTELRKDLLSFQMTKPLHRFIVLRCRVEMVPVEARKLVYSIEEQLTMRPVRFILVQSPKEHSEVTIHCVSANKFDSVYDELYNFGWRFHGSEGPPKSKEVMLKEGTMFEVTFRGNIKFDEKYHPAGKKVMRCYNSQLPCQLKYTITEADKHLQKAYDFYKGIVMISQVDKGMVPTITDHQITAGSTKSSTGSVQVHTKRASSHMIQSENKKKVLCELLIQLAKGIEGGPQTPAAGKICLNLDPIYVEAISTLVPKLGKEWEVLAKGLGLAPGRIEALKTRNKTNPDMVKEDMLYTWIKCSPRASERLPILYHALMNCGRIDLAYKVEYLYSGMAEYPNIKVVSPEEAMPGSSIALNNDNLNNAGDATITSYQPGDMDQLDYLGDDYGHEGQYQYPVGDGLSTTIDESGLDTTLKIPGEDQTTVIAANERQDADVNDTTTADLTTIKDGRESADNYEPGEITIADDPVTEVENTNIDQEPMNEESELDQSNAEQNGVLNSEVTPQEPEVEPPAGTKL